MLKWTTKYSPNFEEIRGVAFGAKTYVAVGDNNTLLYSADATNWMPASLPPGKSYNLRGVEFAFGQFFAVGNLANGGQSVLLISNNGRSWTDASEEFKYTMAYGTPERISAVDSSFSLSSGGAQAVFVLTANGHIAMTTDGVRWTNTPLGYSTALALDSQVYGRNAYQWDSLTVSVYTGMLNRFRSSLPQDLSCIVLGNQTYVGVGPGRRLAYSSTTSNFTYTTAPAIADYTGVAFGQDMFVAVGTNGTVVVSYDLGRSWRTARAANLAKVTLNGVRYVGNRFIAYGGGRIVTGQPINKRNWSAASLPSGAHAINGLASNGKIIVAVGGKGQILYSSTGTSWSKAPPTTSRDLYRVVYDPATKAFYATGANGTLLRSTNGRRWQPIDTPGSGYYSGVARAGKMLIALGGTKKQFLQSLDGKKWTAVTETLIDFGGSILGDGSAAYVFGPSGKFLIKRGKAKNWVSVRGASTVFTDLTFSNKSIFATAANGRLFSTSQAKPGTWKSVDTRTTGWLLGIAANAAAARQIAAVGQFGLVYSQPKAGQWRLEMLEHGTPQLSDVIKFKNNWVVAGARGARGYIGHTKQN
jgi:hypothetical protein